MQRFFSSLSRRSIIFAALALVLLSGCKKQEYEELIAGKWEKVPVENIDETSRIDELWWMEENVLKIYRYPATASPDLSDLESLNAYDQGFYVIERKGTTMYLKLSNLNYTTFNTSWEIFQLDRDKLIISIEVPGGIFYKEFVKKTGN